RPLLFDPLVRPVADSRLLPAGGLPATPARAPRRPAGTERLGRVTRRHHVAPRTLDPAGGTALLAHPGGCTFQLAPLVPLAIDPRAPRPQCHPGAEPRRVEAWGRHSCLPARRQTGMSAPHPLDPRSSPQKSPRQIPHHAPQWFWLTPP